MHYSRCSATFNVCKDNCKDNGKQLNLFFQARTVSSKQLLQRNLTTKRDYNMAEQTPSLLQRLSDSLLSQDTLSARYTVKTSTESTPLLCSGSLTPARAPGTVSSARKQSNNTRPAITRAVTEPVATTTSTSTEVSATPLLSRPSLHRAATAASAYLAFVQGQIRDVNSSRPSFLHRATNVVAASLATNLLAAHRDGDRPAAPTFWADHIHREPLL